MSEEQISSDASDSISYSASLDASNVDFIYSLYSAADTQNLQQTSDEAVPSISSISRQRGNILRGYEVQAKGGTRDSAQIKDDITKIDNIRYRCCVCNISVPAAYKTQHCNSALHKIYETLANMILEKFKNKDDEKTHGNTGIHFCDVCTKVMNINKKERHEQSQRHRSFVSRVEYLGNLLDNIKELEKEKQLTDDETDDEEFENKIQEITDENSKNIETEKSTEDSNNDIFKENVTQAIQTATDVIEGQSAIKSDSADLNDYLNHIEMIHDIYGFPLNLLYEIDDKNYIKIIATNGDTVKISLNNFHAFYEKDNNTIRCMMCYESNDLVGDEIEQHKYEHQHVLNITTNIEDKHCIRQFHSDFSHCALCNVVVNNDVISCHINDLGHNSRVEETFVVSKNRDGDQNKAVEIDKGNVESIGLNSELTLCRVEDKASAEYKRTKGDNMNYNSYFNYVNMVLSICEHPRINTYKIINDDYLEVTAANGDKMKVTFDHFHSYWKMSDGTVKCMVCFDSEYLVNDEIEKHKYEPDHILQITLPMKDKHCLRKFNPEYSHCALCNIICYSDIHMNSEDHNSLVEEALLYSTSRDGEQSEISSLLKKDDKPIIQSSVSIVISTESNTHSEYIKSTELNNESTSFKPEEENLSKPSKLSTHTIDSDNLAKYSETATPKTEETIYKPETKTLVEHTEPFELSGSTGNVTDNGTLTIQNRDSERKAMITDVPRDKKSFIEKDGHGKDIHEDTETKRGIMNCSIYIQYIKTVLSICDRPLTNIYNIINNDYMEIKAINGDTVKLSVNSFHTYFEINSNLINCLACCECKDLVDDEMEKHKYEPDHILKITVPIQDRHCIRKVHREFSHCAVCNVIVVNDIRYHTNSAGHKSRLEEAFILYTSRDNDKNVTKEIDNSSKSDYETPVVYSRDFEPSIFSRNEEKAKVEFKDDEQVIPSTDVTLFRSELETAGGHKRDKPTKIKRDAIVSRVEYETATANSGAGELATLSGNIIFPTAGDAISTVHKCDGKTRILSNDLRIKLAKNDDHKVNIGEGNSSQSTTAPGDAEGSDSTNYNSYINYIKMVVSISKRPLKNSYRIINIDYIEITATNGDTVQLFVNNFHTYFGIANDITRCLMCQESDDLIGDQIEKHKYEPEHILKIISPMEDRHCIRKLHGEYNHCALCNVIVINDICYHINGISHNSRMKEALIPSTNIGTDPNKIMEIDIPSTEDETTTRVVTSSEGESVAQSSDAMASRAENSTIEHKRNVESAELSTDATASGAEETLVEHIKDLEITELSSDAAVFKAEETAAEHGKGDEQATLSIDTSEPDNEVEQVIQHSMKIDDRVKLINFISQYCSTDTYKIINNDFMEITVTNGDTMKVSFDNFHGFYKHQDRLKCMLCWDCDDLIDNQIEEHEYKPDHILKITPPLADRHCIRKYNSETSHCVLCNIFVSNKDIHYHVNDVDHKFYLKEALLNSKNRDGDEGETTESDHISKSGEETFAPKSRDDEPVVISSDAISGDEKDIPVEQSKDGELTENDDTVRNDNESSNCETIYSYMIENFSFDNVKCKICRKIIPKAVKEIIKHCEGEFHLTLYNTLLEYNNLLDIQDYYYCKVCQVKVEDEAELIHIQNEAHLHNLEIKKENCFGLIKDHIIQTKRCAECAFCYLKMKKENKIIKEHDQCNQHELVFKLFLQKHKINIDDNTYHCKICNVRMGRSSLLLSHVEYKGHRKNLAEVDPEADNNSVYTLLLI